ncbi:MAG: response regulator [Clostridia bacterium]
MGYKELKKAMKILLVDDDLEYLQITSLFLRSKGYNIITCSSGQEAIDKVAEDNISIILIDYYMPGMTGEEAINKIRETNKEAVIILQTGYSGQQPPLETLERLKIQNYYDKTEGADKLHLQVLSAVRVYAQQTQIMLEQYRKQTLTELISGIAQELQDPIMSLSAGIEAIKVVAFKHLPAEEQEKLQRISSNNIELVGKIDKVLSALISQSNNDVEGEECLKVVDITTRLECILYRELKANGLKLEIEDKTKKDVYIIGKLTDATFILIEAIKNILKQNASENNESIKLVFTEDEQTWKIHIIAKNIKLPLKVAYLLEQFSFENDGLQFVYSEDANEIGVVIYKIKTEM